MLATEAAGRDPSPEAVRRRYFPAVEGMRGVAALAVVAGHSVVFGHQQPDHLNALGFWVAKFGVTIFFAISGFLLYRPFVAARASGTTTRSIVPGYLWRRAVRILPAYWVALTLLAIWPGVPDVTYVFSSHWWLFYGLLQVYSNSTLLYYGGLQTAWTLCVEITFYLVLPLLAVFLADRGVAATRRRGIGWEIGLLGGLGVLSVLAYGWLTSRPDVAYLDITLLGTFTWFVWGMLLAAVQIGHPPSASWIARLLARPFPTWVLAVIVFALVPLEVFPRLGLGPYPSGTCDWFVLGLAAGLFLAPATLGDSGSLVRVLLANRVVVFLGTVSYGIYLYHFPILAWLLGQGFVLRSGSIVLVTFALTASASVACGAASWFLVERPLMRRARSIKALARSRPESAAEPRPDGEAPLTALSPDK